LRNFAIFLLLGNIAWWTWQLFFHKTELTDPKEVQHSTFAQAEKKLLILGEVPLGSRVEMSNRVSELPKGAEVEAQQDSPPLVSAANTVAAPPESVRAIPEPWCGSTDSFASQESTKKIQTEWLKMGGEAEQELVKEPGSSIWWVYLSAVKDEDAAAQVLRQLREKGIDSYYMRTGELAGGISLGVFSRKDSAVGVQGSIREKGYAAEVRAIQRVETKFRITLKLHDREKIHELRAQELLAKYSAMQVKEIACK
jgi:cell division septation protein DedD